MIRALRRGDTRIPRNNSRSATRRDRVSTAFTRRSLGLSNPTYRNPQRAASGPVETHPPPTSPISPTAPIAPSGPNAALDVRPSLRTFDPLALVRRLPPFVQSFAHVKSARSMSVFSRYERYWLELRGSIVVMNLDDDLYVASASAGHTSAKESSIAAVFAIEKCHVSRARSAKSTVLRISKPGQSQHIWLRFEDEAECDMWEKALNSAASRRVVGISDFEFISPIGKGASGKVFLVSDRNTGEKLALKVIDKAKVFESRSGFRHALDERLALEMVDGHPFFSRLRYAFQTRSFFYLAIDFYDGGDLYQYLRTHQGRLRESQVRSVAAEVCLALEHMHNLGFVYRDLKPENVLLDSKGHVRLADFGLCKLLRNKSLTNTICGTHTYAAPEMLAVRNYGISIDLWAYGVFVYHILRGRTPYEARDLDQVIANMNNRRIRFSSSTSPELVSMIKKLLDWNPETRLGCGPAGMIEVRGHSFFKGLDWRKVYQLENEEGGLFASAKQASPIRHAPVPRAPRVVVPAPQTQTVAPSSCAAAHEANDSGETPSTMIFMGGDTNVGGDGGDVGNTTNVGSMQQAIPINVQAGEARMQDACVPMTSTGTESDEIESPQKAASRSKRIVRPKTIGNLGATWNSKSGKAGRNKDHFVEQSHSTSLRDKMVAAAEQDDLRNFDMSEWGKISVDNDHDDANYGDGSLWPISKARRRLVEDERMIAGFSYCSSSSPFPLPDNL